MLLSIIFISAMLVGMKDHLIVVFDLSFPKDKWYEQFFMYYLAIHISSMEKCLFLSLAHSKMLLSNKSLIRLWFAMMFFHSVGCLTFFMVFFEIQKFFKFSLSSIYLLIFHCVVVCFSVSYLRNHGLTISHDYVTPLFSSKSFIIVTLTCMSMVSFELIFAYIVG